MNETHERVEIAEYERPGHPLRDGIGEEDNAIPLWFHVSFLATIVFAALYLVYYAATGWTSTGQWAEEVAAFEAAHEASPVAVSARNPYRGDAAAIAEGKQVFTTICAACHKPDGSGLVGPSLVDPYWKYGGADADRFQSVMQGRPGGMPPWGPQLGQEKVWKVLAYLETLPTSSVPGVGAPGYAAPTPGPAPGS